MNAPIARLTTASASAAGSPSTPATAVYEGLRRDIRGGVLRPGQKPKVEFVRDRYRVGNSPVRELEAHYQRTANIILGCMDSAAQPQATARRARAVRKQPARVRGA